MLITVKKNNYWGDLYYIDNLNEMIQIFDKTQYLTQKVVKYINNIKTYLSNTLKNHHTQTKKPHRHTAKHENKHWELSDYN